MSSILEDEKRINEILVKGDYITATELERSIKEASMRHVSLTEWLTGEGIITRDLLGQAIAESLKISYANIEALQPSKEFILRLPEEVARHYHEVLFKEEELSVTVATSEPESEDLIKELKNFFCTRHL